MVKRKFAPDALVRVRFGQVARPMILAYLRSDIPELNLTQSGMYRVERIVDDGRGLKLKHIALAYPIDDFELAPNEETLAASL